MLNRDFGISCTFPQIKITPEELAQRPDNYQKLFEFLAQPKTGLVEVNEANKTYFRPLMQWMGGYFVAKVDFGIWYKKILSMVQAEQSAGINLAVVGGLRYPQDAAILKEAGALIVEVKRPDQPEADISDATERQRQDILTDTTICNDGSLSELQTLVATLYADLKQGQLKPAYSAKG